MRSPLFGWHRLYVSHRAVVDNDVGSERVFALVTELEDLRFGFDPIDRIALRDQQVDAVDSPFLFGENKAVAGLQFRLQRPSHGAMELRVCDHGLHDESEEPALLHR